MPQRRLLFLLLFGFHICSLVVIGKTLIYEEKNKDQLTTHFISIETTPSGFLIDLKSKSDGIVISQKFKLDRNLATLNWSFTDSSEKTQINAIRIDNMISLNGQARGKRINKHYKINGLPWNQTFNIGLERFAQSTDKSMKFWAVGTKGPGYMKITKFKVKKQKKEIIELGDKKINSQYITISLSGLLSMFWTGHYWYRDSDGRFLRYKGKNGPGKPVSIMNLISETD